MDLQRHSTLVYRPQIDGLRFIFFLSVFVFHSDLRRFGFFAHGVSGFFVLSGFLITGVLMSNQNLKNFYFRRAARIFPAYFLVLTLASLFGGLGYLGWHYTYLFNLKLFWMSVNGSGELWSFLSNWETQGIHFWSLCVEEQYYLLFPLVFLWISKNRWVHFFGIGILISISIRLYLTKYYSHAFSSVILPVAGEYMLWGGLMAVLREKGLLPKAKPEHLAVAGLVIICLCYLSFRPVSRVEFVSLQPQLFQSVLAVGFAWLVAGVFDCQNWISKALGSQLPRYLGKISYGCYLIHLFTWQMISNPILRFGITVGLASLMWHLIEKPINLRRNNVKFV